MSNLMIWDKETFERFKKVYEKAVEEKKDSFFFEDQEFLTSYAKYVIEYLTFKFKR